MRKALPSTPQKILVMRYRFIGDTVLLIPFLKQLKEAFPKAVIDVLVAPNSGEVLTHCPYINQLLYFDTTRKHQYEGPADQKPQSFWSYVSLLRRNQYDCAFVLKRSFSSALLAFLAGIPQRIGFNTEGRGWLLTHRVPYDKEKHESECFLDTLRAINGPTRPPVLDAWLTDTHKQQAETLLNNALTPEQRHQPKLLIHVTASNAEKCWPNEFWTALIPWLLETFSITLHCAGALGDQSAYDPLFKSLTQAQQKRCFNWCGQTTLLESQALLSHMDGAIGVDSGTLHLATAVSVPVIALFNKPNASKWAPLSASPATPATVIQWEGLEPSLESVKDHCHTLLITTHNSPQPVSASLL